jgi:hypothetical protein
VSERRTAEIKIRLTPQEKGWWQAMADEESTTVSELIRREMNARARVRRDAKAANPITMLDPDLSTFQALLGAKHVRQATAEEAMAWIEPRLVLEAPGHDSPLDGMSEACIQAASCTSTPCQCNAAPQEVVGTTDEVGAKGDRCAHGIAPWQFCGLCR